MHWKCMKNNLTLSAPMRFILQLFIVLEPWISQFPYPGSYRCMQNYTKPLNPMQWKHNIYIYIYIYNSKIKRKAIRELYL